MCTNLVILHLDYNKGARGINIVGAYFRDYWVG